MFVTCNYEFKTQQSAAKICIVLCENYTQGEQMQCNIHEIG